MVSISISVFFHDMLLASAAPRPSYNCDLLVSQRWLSSCSDGGLYLCRQIVLCNCVLYDSMNGCRGSWSAAIMLRTGD